MSYFRGTTGLVVTSAGAGAGIRTKLGELLFVAATGLAVISAGAGAGIRTEPEELLFEADAGLTVFCSGAGTISKEGEASGLEVLRSSEAGSKAVSL